MSKRKRNIERTMELFAETPKIGTTFSPPGETNKDPCPYCGGKTFASVHPQENGGLRYCTFCGEYFTPGENNGSL